MADKKQDSKLVDIDNVEVTELEDEDLDEVSGGTTDNNCNCVITAAES